LWTAKCTQHPNFGERLFVRAGWRFSASQTVKGAGNQMFSHRSFHALGHSFTSALANQNVSSELRMKLTAHKTAGEPQKYTHHEMDHLRAAVKKIPSLR